MAPSRRTYLLLVASTILLVLAPGLAACGGDTNQPSEKDITPAASASGTASLTVRDPWAKAAPSGMTAVFGTLTNPTDRDLTVTAASSALSATVELHEVAMVDGAMRMRPKAGGFMVPAHGTHELRPGGDHIMFLNLTAPVAPGADVAVTLTLSDGTTVPFTAVGKDFAGGNETYVPGQDAAGQDTAGQGAPGEGIPGSSAHGSSAHGSSGSDAPLGGSSHPRSTR